MTTLPEKPASVRLAGPADEGEVYALLLDLNKDNGMGLPHNPQIVLNQIRLGTQGRGGLIGVIERHGKIIASVGLFLQPAAWFTDLYGLSELWLFVKPGQREFQHHYRDLFAFMAWARAWMEADMRKNGEEHPLPLLTSVVSPSRLESKRRLWCRFAEPVGHLFAMR